MEGARVLCVGALERLNGGGVALALGAHLGEQLFERGHVHVHLGVEARGRQWTGGQQVGNPVGKALK